MLDYDNDCVKVTNPFEGRQQYKYNAIGDTDYYEIYGPPDKDGFFTDPPIGIRFDSYQDSPAIPHQYNGNHNYNVNKIVFFGHKISELDHNITIFNR